jgi:hypothetical protein
LVLSNDSLLFAFFSSSFCHTTIIFWHKYCPHVDLLFLIELITNWTVQEMTIKSCLKREVLVFVVACCIAFAVIFLCFGGVPRTTVLADAKYVRQTGAEIEVPVPGLGVVVHGAVYEYTTEGGMVADKDHSFAPAAAFLAVPFAEPPVGERRFEVGLPRRPKDSFLYEILFLSSFFFA